MPNIGDVYTCALCKGKFEKAITDEEAMEKTHQYFGNSVKMEECDIVCDDCWNLVKFLKFW